jgi:hypothetical protein
MTSSKRSPEADAYLEGELAREQQELAAFDKAVKDFGLRLRSQTAGGGEVDVTHHQRARHEAIIAEIRRVLGK